MSVLSYIAEAGSQPGLSDLVNYDTGSARTSFSTTNVPSGTYYVRVRALNGWGTSPPSTELVITVGGGAGGCSQPPGAPTGLQWQVSGNAVTLTWSPGGGCAAQSYQVLVGSRSGVSDLGVFDVRASPTLSASAASGTYFVRVQGRNCPQRRRLGVMLTCSSTTGVNRSGQRQHGYGRS